MLAVFRQLAADSARRLQATGHPIPEGFDEAVARGVLAAVPGPEELRSKIGLRYRVGVFALGSEMLAEQRKALDERRRLEEAEGELRLERQRREARARVVQGWVEREYYLFTAPRGGWARACGRARTFITMCSGMAGPALRRRPAGLLGSSAAAAPSPPSAMG
jgi:hypothetical protein